MKRTQCPWASRREASRCPQAPSEVVFSRWQCAYAKPTTEYQSSLAELAGFIRSRFLISCNPLQSGLLNFKAGIDRRGCHVGTTQQSVRLLVCFIRPPPPVISRHRHKGPEQQMPARHRTEKWTEKSHLDSVSPISTSSKPLLSPPDIKPT